MSDDEGDHCPFCGQEIGGQYSIAKHLRHDDCGGDC